jgi:hypothetical protein
LIQQLYDSTRKSQREASSELAEQGRVIRNGLVAKRRMHDFRTSKGTGPCVLSEQRFDELQACGSVRDVIAKVMKYMELLNIPNRDLNLSLVNSEYFKVVMSFSGETRYEGKPDLFVLDPAMVKHLVMPSNGLYVAGSYGVLPNWKCRISVNSVWEAKRHSLENKDFQELCNYLKCFTEGAHDELQRPIWMRGVLFDKKGFELVKCYNGIIETLDGFIN